MSGTAIESRNLVKNERGAIMVVGIFFACMMIGWMWMLVGLGDAMIWRDRSQEAADAISYSSSAIQAQGMNLISFVNVLMLILTAVYMVMSFVYNILDFLHIVFGSSKDDKWCLPTSCGAREGEIEIIATAADAVGLPMEWLNEVGSEWCNYADIISYLHDGNTNGSPAGYSVGGLLGGLETGMIDIMPPLSKFEDFIAYASPWAGELAGVYTATQYQDWGKDRWGVALSGTLIPATMTPGQPGSLFPVHKYKSCANEECTSPLNCDAHNPQNCADFNGGDKREGLPVQIPDGGFTALCDYAGSAITNAVIFFLKSSVLVQRQY